MTFNSDVLCHTDKEFITYNAEILFITCFLSPASFIMRKEGRTVAISNKILHS